MAQIRVLVASCKCFLPFLLRERMAFRKLFSWLGLGILLISAQFRGQACQASDLLHQFSESLEDVSRKVSPAVVQIIVTGYGVVEKEGQSNTALIGRQRVMGSGVIMDSSGYIITNAHVVSGAQKVQVLLTSPEAAGSPVSVMKSMSRSLNAQIIGVDKQIDIALLKVEAKGLPSLSFAEYQRIRQGEVVLAFGSPEGLENTVTMGVISSVARQVMSDRPMVYIQTDAPINPGNSGGPLVDADGNVVGLNTFIITQGGGSEGVGFAIPSSIVNHVYRQLKQFGHVHRKVVGIAIQSITPGLAESLQLPRDRGMIIADVLPGGPAESAGLKIQDIVLSVDGKSMQSIPQFNSYLFLHDKGDKLKLEVLRGNEKMAFEIPVMERHEEEDRLADLVKPEKNFIPKLGILGIPVDEKIAQMRENLRIDSGIVVAALTVPTGAPEIGLETGDIIHSVNGNSVRTLKALSEALDKILSGSPVVLQVEREGQLHFIEFEM
jgi:serine protease Do